MLIAVVLELCRDHIRVFEVAPSHIRFISSSSAAKFGVYFKKSLTGGCELFCYKHIYESYNPKLTAMIINLWGFSLLGNKEELTSIPRERMNKFRIK